MKINKIKKKINIKKILIKIYKKCKTYIITYIKYKKYINL